MDDNEDWKWEFTRSQRSRSNKKIRRVYKVSIPRNATAVWAFYTIQWKEASDTWTELADKKCIGHAKKDEDEEKKPEVGRRETASKRNVDDVYRHAQTMTSISIFDFG